MPVTVTVLGGCGGWPIAGAACSGYLVESDGFRALIDPGYATFPRLLEHCDAADVGAVLISHGHPDHCADLNPLLRARVLGDPTVPPLPVFAPPGSLGNVLALDRPGMLDGGLEWREFHPGSSFRAGPFTVQTWPLPHWVPNAGLRLRAAGTVIAYTGDTGPSPDLAALAADADVLIADASYADRVPADSERYLSSATVAGRVAGAADAGRLVLAHLMPGTDPDACTRAASASYGGAIDVAVPGLTIGALRRWPRRGSVSHAGRGSAGELPRSREFSGIRSAARATRSRARTRTTMRRERRYQQKLSNSRFRTPSRKACHSSGVNLRTGPAKSLLLRTPTPPSGRLATSTQFPFA